MPKLSDILKKGSDVPVAGDLIAGGIGIDVVNGRIYSAKDDDSIIDFLEAVKVKYSNTTDITSTTVQGAIQEVLANYSGNSLERNTVLIGGLSLTGNTAYIAAGTIITHANGFNSIGAKDTVEVFTAQVDYTTSGDGTFYALSDGTLASSKPLFNTITMQGTGVISLGTVEVSGGDVTAITPISRTTTVNQLDVIDVNISGKAIAVTPAAGTSDTQIATTEFVTNKVGNTDAKDIAINAINGLTGDDVQEALEDLQAKKATIDAPALTGVATTANTPAYTDNSTKIANTAFVHSVTSKQNEANEIPVAAISGLNGDDVQEVLETVATQKANLASPTFTGSPKAPTVAETDSSTNIATTAFVKSVVDLQNEADEISIDAITGLTGTNVQEALEDLQLKKATIDSPALTGSPTAPTAAEDDDSTAIATTEFVQTEIATKAEKVQDSMTDTKYVDKTAIEYKIYLENGDIVLEEL
jgi:ribosomal protein L12E/L44/L45/RPP1/RPP2